MDILNSEAAFCVYSANNKCVNDSYVSGDNIIELKEGDIIAFVGKTGDTFGITMK